MLAAGEIDQAGFVELVASSAPPPALQHDGHRVTMNALAEALGMSLTAARRSRLRTATGPEMAYLTGRRIVEMVHEDLKPSDVMTREAFENAIVVNSAIGGSTNAPIHITAIARHIGVDLPLTGAADRPRGATDRRPAARRPVPRRGVPPGRRRAGGGARADGTRPDQGGRPDGHRRDHGREAGTRPRSTAR